jgi:hypothetical protein
LFLADLGDYSSTVRLEVIGKCFEEVARVTVARALACRQRRVYFPVKTGRDDRCLRCRSCRRHTTMLLVREHGRERGEISRVSRSKR